MTALHPLLLSWMDPNWLLDHFHTEFFWLSMAIIFVECGVLFPFLPGDTLLFSLGIFISSDRISPSPWGGEAADLLVTFVVMSVAAILGNVAGYEIGKGVGEPLRHRDGRILKRKYFDQTSDFFDKHGNKALVIGRFIPFVRTYITVVAGIGRMERRRFFLWSLVGALGWVLSVLLLGYFLGSAFPTLADNIDKAIIVIVVFSLIPVAYEWRKHRRQGGADSLGAN